MRAKPSRRAFLNQLHHLLGAVAAIGQDDASGGRTTFGFVRRQRVRRFAVGLNFPGQNARIQDRLRGAVRSDRIHCVCGIAQ